MMTQVAKRAPKCALCKVHGFEVDLKGHKKVCPWLSCQCEKCELVQEKRRVMAAQIKLRRQQAKEDQKDFMAEKQTHYGAYAISA